MSDVLVRVAHASMQFSDSDGQHTQDARKLFNRAASRGVRWLTGTEAGEQPFKGILRTAADEHGYTFHEYKSNWVAVRRSGMTAGSLKRHGQTVVDNDETVGRGHDLNLCWVDFATPDIGHVSVIASHLATRGRPPADPNLDENRRLARALGDLARKQGLGAKLVFYGGDQNIPDRDHDTFFGQPLTSLWDELGKYENTGHGNIDVIASYDRDGRVKGVSINALDDREFFLHSDHFLVEGAFKVRPLSQLR